MLELSDQSRSIAGVLLLTLLAVEFGGLSILRLYGRRIRAAQAAGDEPAGDPDNALQKSFWRAGHAHAGVWVTLSLVIQVLADASHLTGGIGYVARIGVPLGAILLPAGFFLSAVTPGATKPNGLFVLVYLGALSFAIGVATLGIGLLTA